MGSDRKILVANLVDCSFQIQIVGFTEKVIDSNSVVHFVLKKVREADFSSEQSILVNYWFFLNIILEPEVIITVIEVKVSFIVQYRKNQYKLLC